MCHALLRLSAPIFFRTIFKMFSQFHFSVFSRSVCAAAVIRAIPVFALAPAVSTAADPVNLQIREDSTIMEDLAYVTENVGLGGNVYSSLRVFDDVTVDIQSANAYFTVHNMPNAQGTGDYTAFAGKINAGFGKTIGFNGGNLYLNAASNYGAQGISVYTSGNGEATTLLFDNTGDVNITAVVEGSGVGTSNAIGILGNWQVMNVTDCVQNFNVSVYGSGRFNGSAVDSNGTAGLFFAGDTVTIDSKQLNIRVIAGQDADVTLATGVDSNMQSNIDFDAQAAAQAGTAYGVTYGLNNKGDTTIGSGTTTSIVVNDGYWNAVGISNDPMYLDESTSYSSYNLSNLAILGDLSVDVTGSSLGETAGDVFNGTTNIVAYRLTDTYGIYAAVTRYDGVDGYENQKNVVLLGSAGKTIHIKVANNSEGHGGDVYGVYGEHAQITFNGSQTAIDVSSKTNGTVYGVRAENGAVIDFNADQTSIVVAGKNAVAVSVGDSTASVAAATEESAQTAMAAQFMKASANADASTEAVSDSKVIFRSNGASISATGENGTAVQVGAQGTVEVQGTVAFEGETALAAEVGSMLLVAGASNAASVLSVLGKVQNEGTTELENAVYAVDGDGSQLGTVKASASTISFGSGSYAISSLAGESKTLLVNDIAGTQINIANKEGAATYAASGKANDQFSNVEEAAAALAQAVRTENDDALGANRILLEQGAVNNGLEAELTESNELSNVRVKENETLAAFGDVALLSAFQWRHEVNDLTKRMGELRDAPEGVGSWVRFYGSQQSHGSVENKNTSVQVGADFDVGAGWKVGAAFSYTDGSSTNDLGDADNKAYGFGIYGTWLSESGQFVDLIAKYSRLDTDFAVNGMDGSIDNNAWSVSAEYGWHFPVAGVGFVEPQVELTYGSVLGDDTTASNGVHLEQDDYESFIGRVGVRGGFYFPENKGTIYLRASVAHDFDGDMRSTASLGKASNSIEDDLGGTWYEYGVGGNFNFTDNCYGYVDLERQSGGEVVEDWRWNLGVRYSF